MSESNRAGDVVYGYDGRWLLTTCRLVDEPMPACAYCSSESRWSCDAPGTGAWGRCGMRLCDQHTTKVGKDNDLCHGHVTADDAVELVKRGDASQGAWWEAVETRAASLGDVQGLPNTIDLEPWHFLLRAHRPRS